jgi:uncharacterized membrane protein
MIDHVSFAGGAGWGWLALAAAVLLLALAWAALRPRAASFTTLAVGLVLRGVGIGLLLFCLLDPQWVAPQVKPGANFFAVLADNSESLQIADAGAATTRGQQVRAALTGGGARWLAALADEFQVRPYVFDRDLRRVRDFTELDFAGASTALGAALRGVRERYAGQPLAGVLLFTDGDATDLPAGLGDVAGLPPVYPVVVGSADNLRYVRLDHVDLQQTAFDDAPVSLRAEVVGRGAAGQNVTVQVRPLGEVAGANRTVPAPQTLRLRDDTEPAVAQFDWKPDGTGAQFYEVGAAQEMNRRAVLVDRGRPEYRILYVAGRPNWEFKFLNRALEEDPQLQMTALIRIAKREPKFSFLGRPGETTNPLFMGFGASNDDTQRYDEPVLERVNARDERELQAGFPRTAAELFAYDAVILDAVESAFFTQDQLLLLRRFATERGGGLLMLGGADSLENGAYADTPLAAALPVYLDRTAPAPPQGNLTWNLTREGWLEPWTRVRANEVDEQTRLNDMPRLKVANALAGVKPGATVLATVTDEAGHEFPALIAQNYGAGRVACLGVGDLWRWGLRSPADQADLARFWRQLARWLVTDTPARVELRVEPAAASDGVNLQVSVRDQEYHPLDLANVRLTIRRFDAAAGGAPAFRQVTLPAEASADTPGEYDATFAPRDPGAYLVEAEATNRAGELAGRAESGWVYDPAAEEFRTLAPNRPLLEELARRTGGAVIGWDELDGLARRLAQKPAPITEIASQPLWHHGTVFLLVLGCFLAEWAWRRWRGLP